MGVSGEDRVQLEGLDNAVVVQGSAANFGNSGSPLLLSKEWVQRRFLMSIVCWCRKRKIEKIG